MDCSGCDSKHLVPTSVKNKTETFENEDGDTLVITKPRKRDKTSSGQFFPHFNEQRYSGELKAKPPLADDDYLTSDISYTGSDHQRDDPHHIFSQDQIFSRLLGGEETSANYAANEALITDTSEDTKAGADFASLGEYQHQQYQQQQLQQHHQQQESGVGDDYQSHGELVCTLLVPDKVNNNSLNVPQIHDNDNSGLCEIVTPDSDRDSGCFSEEQAAESEEVRLTNQRPVLGSHDQIRPIREQYSGHVISLDQSEEEEVRLTDVDTNLTENRDVCKLKRGTKCVQQQLNFPRPSYRPVHNYTGGGGPRPFQRKIWKRRNGWFRVRYPVTGQARASLRSHG